MKKTCPTWKKMPSILRLKSKMNCHRQNLFEELTLLDIHSQLDHSQQSNPQDNYETFSKLIKCAKDKHLPKNTIIGKTSLLWNP